MADVFISYQRKQEIFVGALQKRFEAIGKDVWVDVDDIAKAADWLQQIERGIEGATFYICVLTLDYVVSEICTKELSHARLHKKQIIPIVRDIDPKVVAQALHGLPWETQAAENWDVLRALNWIFFRESDDFEKAFQELLTATETDLPFEELRARLTVRAHEWLIRHRNTSYVLRGTDLIEAERWLAQSATKKLGASVEQFEYITGSRKAAVARQRVTVGALSAGLLVATVLAIVAIVNGNRAQANFLGAESQRLAIAANSALQTDNFDLATLLGIRAMRTSYSEGAEITLSRAMAQTAGTIFRGHTGLINSVAYSPDGQYGLTAGEDGTVRLWQISNGQEVRRFFTGERSACFSPDGRFVLAGGEGGVIQLWDIATGQLLRDFKGQTQAIRSVAYSPDGRYILTGSVDRTARLWDVSSGQQIRTFDHGPDNVASIESVAFAADGRYALTARGWNGDRYDGSAGVWDVETGQLLREFSGQGAALTSIAYSPSQNGFVLTSGYDYKARLWDWFSGQTVQVFSGNSQSVIYAAVSADGERVLTAGDGFLWNANSGNVVRRLTEDGVAIEHAAFSPDGRYVFGSIGDHARLWDLNTGSELRRVTSTAAPQSHASFSPDGLTILTVDANHSIVLRELTSGTIKMQFSSSTAIDAQFSPDGQYIYAMGTPVERWAITGGTRPSSLPDIPKADSFTISPDGRYMLLIQGGPTKAVELWSLDSPHLVRIFDANHRSDMPSISIGGSYSLAYGPDGHSIAAGSTSGIVTLWDLATGAEIHHLGTANQPNNVVTALTYSLDGQLLLSGDADGAAHIWEVATGHERFRLAGHTSGLTAVAFSPDNRFAVTVGGGGDNAASSELNMRLWDTNTGQQLQIFGTAGSVISAAVSPDNRYILTTGADGTVRLWPVSRNALIELACSRVFRDLTASQRTIYGFDDSPSCAAFGVPPVVNGAEVTGILGVVPKTTELAPVTLSIGTVVTAQRSPTTNVSAAGLTPSPTFILVPATIQFTLVPIHTPRALFEPLSTPTDNGKG